MEKLTSKEEEVMELIWQLGQCAPKDVSSLYPYPQPSANAIAQVFQALEKKGYLTHEPKGRGFVYRGQTGIRKRKVDECYQSFLQ